MLTSLSTNLYSALKDFKRSLANKKSGVKNGLGFLFSHYLMSFPSQTLRHKVLVYWGLKLGKGSLLYMGTEIRDPHQITIGSGTTIGHNCILDGRGGLQIGNNVNFSSEVMVWTMQHDHRSPTFGCMSAPVVIEDYAWVSCRAILLPGVTIGKGAVVAAGAVVTKSVEPYTIVAGIPAKEISKRTQDLNYVLGMQGAIPFV